MCFMCNHRRVGRHRDPEMFRRVAEYLEQGTEWFAPKKAKKKKTQKKRKK